jgi:aryl carrier-like protein
LPHPPRGKLDRRALAQPDTVRPEMENSYLAPRTGIEEKLVQLWSEVLRIEKVGVQDNFFDLGGHSILMIQMRSRLREVFGQELMMADLFKYPTISMLAQYLEQEPDGRPFAETGSAHVEQRRVVVNRQRASRMGRRAAEKSQEMEDE